MRTLKVICITLICSGLLLMSLAMTMEEPAITPTPSGWAVYGEEGNCTIYRRSVGLLGGSPYVYWTVCATSNYSSTVAVQSQ